MISTSINENGVAVPYVLTLHNQDPNKGQNFLFELFTVKTAEGYTLTERFRQTCYRMPRTVNWFHQGGCLPGKAQTEWHLFEFWTANQDAILEATMAVANELGLTIHLDILKSEDFRTIQAAA